MSYENPARWILARPNQNFAFRPFMFSLEKDEERSAWGLELMNSHYLAACNVKYLLRVGKEKVEIKATVGVIQGNNLSDQSYLYI